MIRVQIAADSPEDAVVRHALDVLRRGGIVAYPTDTLYGLAVDPRDETAVARLFEAKGREDGMAIPLIASSVEQALAAAEMTSIELALGPPVLARTVDDRGVGEGVACARRARRPLDRGDSSAVPSGRLCDCGGIRVLHHCDEREQVGRSGGVTG